MNNLDHPMDEQVVCASLEEAAGAGLPDDETAAQLVGVVVRGGRFSIRVA